MTDPTDDRDISAIVRAATIDPSADFQRTLADRIRSSSGSDGAEMIASADTPRMRRPAWMMLAAAAVVIVVVGVVLVISRSDDGAVELVPAEPDATSLSGQELFAELEGRRWLALERFDDPSPTVLTSDITFTGSADRVEIIAHDGCNGYGGTFRLDGTTITDADITGEGEACEVGVLDVAGDQQIELFADSGSFLLLGADGARFATFTDVATLEPARASDMPGLRYVDRLEAVEFNDTGRGVATLCTQLSWQEHDDGVTVELTDPDRTSCGGAQLQSSRVAIEIRELTTGGTDVLLTPNGLVLVGELGAIELRELPTEEIDPDGAAIGAGALFGFRPGVGVTPDELIEAADLVLGAPDQDTGWVDRRNDGPPIQTCGLNDFRELAWGDLVAGFWGSGSRTVLLYWYVGDERTVGQITPDSELDAPRASSGLTTEHGVAVGDPADAIPDRFNIVRLDGFQDARFGPGSEVERVLVTTRNPDITAGSLDRTVGGGYLVVDGTVAGFGAEAVDC